jgi:hypothetical protein
MVLVQIWLPKERNGENNIGHGSMLITSEDETAASTYVSNWPGSWLNMFYGKGQAKDPFFDESAEGGLPELVYRIVGLDEEAMVNRWTEMKKDLKYSFPVFNCFTTVAEVITAGLTGIVNHSLGDSFIRHEIVIAHVMLISFVHQVQLALRARFAESVPLGVVK